MTFVLLVLLLYFIPSFVASTRQHPDYASIAVLNLFLGWTFIGWVIALVWAVKAFAPPRTQYRE